MNKHYVRDDDQQRINSDFDDSARFAEGVAGVIAFAFLLVLLAWCATGHASDYTRDGGTADWMCCSDKTCTAVIAQKADAVRARDECGKLVDTDGVTRYVRSNAFKITKPGAVTPPPITPPPVTPPPQANGSATVKWVHDGLNVDGFRILYGTAPDALTTSVQVPNAAARSFVIDKLAAGSWQFAVRAYNNNGAETVNSNVASKVVP